MNCIKFLGQGVKIKKIYKKGHMQEQLTLTDSGDEGSVNWLHVIVCYFGKEWIDHQA